MSVWLHDLPNVLRAAGLNVVEYDGWQNRARGSGAYSDWPLCVMWHHTASGPQSDGASDCNYMCNGADSKPIANLYIDRAGTVWVLAAGATNTNGKGDGRSFSRGHVGDDDMNEYAIGVEMANDGVGEAYPQVQIDAMFATSNACNAMCGNTPMDVCTHNEYAPDRKIDPATSFAVQGPWQPNKSTSSGTWELADIQNECMARAGAAPIPGPFPPDPNPQPPLPPEDDEMRIFAYTDDNGTIWVGNGLQKRTIPNMDVFNNYVVLSVNGGGPQMVNGSGQLVRDASDVGYGGPNVIDALGIYIGG